MRVSLGSRVLAAVAFVMVACLAPAQAFAGGGTFESSNAGIPNTLVSTPFAGAGTAGFGSTEQCAPNGLYATNRSESQLAVDPADPTRMLGSSKFFFSALDPISGSGSFGQLVDWSGEYQFHVGVYDISAGQPAGNQLVPGYTCAEQIELNGHTLNGFDATTDPVTAFDTQGNAYAFMLGYNYNNLQNGMYVSKRPAQGAWGQPVEVDSFVGQFGLGHSYDKQWIAADISGGSRTDSLYLIYIDYSVATGRVKFARSTDGGATFSKPKIIGNLDSPHAALPQIAVDGRGFVYASWWGNFQGNFMGPGSLIVVVSEDGGNRWQGPFDAVDFNVITASTPGTYGGAVIPNTTFRDGLPYYLAVDPHGTGVYAAEERWSADTSQAGYYDVILHRGTYDPSSKQMAWQVAGKVNDNTTPTDSFQPVVAADSGTVAVAWYDRRLPCGADSGYFTRPGALNYCINTGVQFYGESAGGLAPHGANIRASAATWDPQQPGDWLDRGVGNLPHSAFGPCFSSTAGDICATFIGDYFGLALANGNAYILNVSTAPQFNTAPLIPPAYRFWNSTAQGYEAQGEALGGVTRYYQQQVLQVVPIP